MPTISTTGQLLAAFGPVVYEADPIGELRARGFTLTPALARALDSAEARSRLLGAERQRRLANLRGRLAPTIQIGPLTRPADGLPGGHHDLTVGLKLDKVDEIIADMYAKHSFPHEVSLASAAGSLAELLAVLRNELIGVPTGSDVSIGQLHLTGPPTTTALPTPTRMPVDTTARLLVHLPVTLDFDRVASSTTPGQTALATLQAVAHFGIAVSAAVSGNEVAISAGPIPGQVASGDPEFLRLTIDSSSPLPPKDGSSGDNIGLAIELGGFQGILHDLAISTTLTQDINVPIGVGIDLLVRHIDLRAVPSTGAGHLMVGLEIGAQPLQVPLTGQPELLERDPFDDSGSTLYVEANAELFRVFVQQAFASGELQTLAQQQASNAIISGADAEFGANSIGLFLQGALVDQCGLFGANFKDVGFNGWTRIELRGVDAGHIHYDAVDSLGLGDADVVDVAECILLSFVDLTILQLLENLAESLGSKVSDCFCGSSSSSTDQIVNLFAPNYPIPLTELLPRMRALGVTIDTSALRIQAALDLVPDRVNTYVYVRTIARGLPEVGGGLPVTGVKVRLMDQDVPPPSGDDAAVPATGTTVHHHLGVTSTSEVSFQPPTADDQLATGTTDTEGRAQLVLTPADLQSGAGVVTTTTTTRRINHGIQISTSTEHAKVVERLPDVYLLLEVPNHQPVDSRTQGGFITNFSSRRWGTFDQPLVFLVPRPTALTHP
jgi:hypothetical protein